MYFNTIKVYTIKEKGRGAMSVAAAAAVAKMTVYKHLDGDEESRIQMSACAMMHRLDALVGHVWVNKKQETEYGKGFTDACKTAHEIRAEVLDENKRRYVYAPDRYSTARGKVDEGMRLLEAEAGFAGLEKMKACGKECQALMDAYAEVWRKIREFDATHINAYVQRTFGFHAFSNEKKANMEEMLRELMVLSVGDT